MKFDVVIGNPPYQDSTSINNRQGAIYPHFYDAASLLGRIYCLISPARFLFNTGLTPTEWNQKMLNNDHLKVVFFKQDSAEIFPNTDIKGGVVIIYGDSMKKFNPIGEFIPNDDLRKIASIFKQTENKSLSSIMFGGRSDLKFNSLFLKDYPESINIRLKEIKKRHPNVSKLSPNEEYEIKSSTFNTLPFAFKESEPFDKSNYYKLLGLFNGVREYRWIENKYLEPRYPGNNNISKYKVFIPESNGSGLLGEIISTPVIGLPNMSATPTFISVGAFDTKVEAENALKYIKTKLARALLSIKKTTQHNPPSKWSFVPVQDFTPNSDIDWTQSISEIDKQLYKKYGLSQEEIDFIESNVKEME